MEYIGPALVALAILAVGMALILRRERRKAKSGRVMFAIFDADGGLVAESIHADEHDAWAGALLGDPYEEALSDVLLAHMMSKGYRCARVRVTEIGDAK